MKHEAATIHPSAFNSAPVLPQAAPQSTLSWWEHDAQAKETRAHPEVKEGAFPIVKCWRWDVGLAGQDGVEESRWAPVLRLELWQQHGELQAHCSSRVASLTCLLHPSLPTASLVWSWFWLSGEQAWNTLHGDLRDLGNSWQNQHATAGEITQCTFLHSSEFSFVMWKRNMDDAVA